jgi:serine/threonine-protein kinase
VFGRRYRLTEKIGTGGMAEVYKAVDDVLGRTVAVKVLHARYAADPNFTARFRQEAQAAANLQSPYIVNIYDWGQDGDTYYIVMEYVRGTDLKTIIQQRGALESKRVAEIGALVCQALTVAHGYDVIHRDIKPHNIMVMPDGSVKVMDFGIARAGNTTMTQTGSVLGTAHYVSPEQAQGRPLTPASDLYSLGIVLYEAATGRLPFEADSPVAVALKQVNDAPTPPRAINPDIDPDLETVIMNAMAKQVADRYDTAEEMRRDLLRVIKGQDVTSVLPAGGPAPRDGTAVMPAVGRGGSTPAADMRPVRRRRLLWPWILLSVLLLGGGLAAAYYSGLLGTRTVTVPDLEGLTVTKAETKLSDVGLSLGQTSDEYSDAEQGTIISQSPAGGMPAEKDSAVDVVVSKGPHLVKVPVLIGLTEADAQKALTDLGLDPNHLPDEFSDQPRGTVIKQTPDPETEVKVGSAVQYVVSSGRKTVIVPKVVGQPKATADANLRNLGFKVTVTEAFNDTVPAGQVISQSLAPNTEVVEGSTVAIVVSRGPAKVTVPDVIGMPMADAIAKIESVGLKSKVVFEPHAENGVVLDQSPKTGQLNRGEQVTIIVDQAAP